MGPGDLIFCALGPDHAHQFYNHTDERFRFLALSNQAQWDLCQYPDSDKLNVRGLAKIYQVEAGVDYYQGETDPPAAWPSEVLAGKLPSP